MALIPCPKCTKEIDDQVDLCPICGCHVNEARIEITEAAKTEKQTPKEVKSGCGVLIGIVIALIILTCRSPNKIQAGLADFKEAIPILRQHSMEPKERETRIDYNWSDIVLAGEKTNVTFYDDAKDGTIDSILYIFSLSGDETADLASIALGFKLL